MSVIELLARAAGIEHDGVGVREDGDEPCGGDTVEGVVRRRQRHLVECRCSSGVCSWRNWRRMRSMSSIEEFEMDCNCRGEFKCKDRGLMWNVKE